MAGAGAGGRVRAEGGAGSPVGLVWGEGEVDMGQRWRAWWRLGERERQERGPGGSWWRLGERERREWVVEARWQCGECGRRGWVCRAGGGSGSAAVCGTGPPRSSPASREVSAGPGGLRVVLPGTGGGGSRPSMDPPRRGAVAAAAGGMGRVTVPGGVGPGGPPWRRLWGRRDTVPGTGGVALGGSWGMGVERLVAAIRYAGTARARGVLARWGRWWAVVVVGVVLVVVVVGPLVVVALVVVGMVLRVWP